MYCKVMTETQAEGQRNIQQRRLIGKIGLAIGIFLIVFVIVLGLFVSVVSANDGSTELAHIYDVIARPILVFGMLFVISGLLAIVLPEGLSQDGIWILKTGPYTR
jgi:uncharacterized integral membrane protein